MVQSCHSSYLKKYINFLILGGTTDITVHEMLEGGKLVELFIASGGPWGGTAVDKQFIQLLIKIVGGPVWHEFQQESTGEYFDMMREFETKKRGVNASVTTRVSKRRATTNIKIPNPLRNICERLNEESIESILTSENFPYKSKIRIKGDKILFDEEMIQDLFMNVLNPMADLVQAILDAEEGKDISVIILAGGFSESPLVQEVFQKKFKTRHRRVLVTEAASLAMLKGAVMFGHRPGQIKARRLQYTYGVNLIEKFVKGKHPENKKVTINHRVYCDDVFEVFIPQGALVEKGHQIKKSYFFESNIKDVSFKIYSSNCTNPSYVDDEGCKLTREIQLDPLLPSTNKETYYIDVTYIFGDTEVEVEIRGDNFDFVYNDMFDYKYN